MDGVNKTLYIPLYGKAYVSKKDIILKDVTAEEIWEKEGFPLKGKAKSKWLAYSMGMRSAVFDGWLKRYMEQYPEAAVLHIGCGMDSRIYRVGAGKHQWYDVDFPEVIEERKRYYEEGENYHMIASDARNPMLLQDVPKGGQAIILLEGISMYLTPEELNGLFKTLAGHFEMAYLLMDCYTVMAAKASKYKNPINEVGVTTVYGVDDGNVPAENTGFTMIKEWDMTPESLVNQLKGSERMIFRKVFGGKFAKKLYRMYEYQK